MNNINDSIRDGHNVVCSVSSINMAKNIYDYVKIPDNKKIIYHGNNLEVMDGEYHKETK